MGKLCSGAARVPHHSAPVAGWSVAARAGFRRGFTLVETIIAMSLVTMLLAIVWTMFGIYTKLESKGVTAAEESALVRAIDRQLRSDLLHTVGIDQRRDITLDPTTDSFASKSTAPEFPENGFLIGNETELHFAVGIEPGSPGSAEYVRVISYEPLSWPEAAEQPTDEFGDGSINTRPRGEFGAAIADLDPYATPVGVARHDRSWGSYLEHRRQAVSSEQLLSTNRPIAVAASDLIEVGPARSVAEDGQRKVRFAPDSTDEIPEIVRLRIQYFDGSSWASRWDSTTDGRLPRAIEVAIDLEMVKEEHHAGRSDHGIDSNRARQPAPAGDSQVALPVDQQEWSDTITIGQGDRREGTRSMQYRMMIAVPAAAGSTGPGAGSNSQGELADQTAIPNAVDQRWTAQSLLEAGP